jgi:hypothetical protein
MDPELRAALNGLTTQIAQVRTDLGGEIAQVRGDLGGEIAGIRADLAALTRTTETIRKEIKVFSGLFGLMGDQIGEMHLAFGTLETSLRREMSEARAELRIVAEEVRTDVRETKSHVARLVGLTGRARTDEIERYAELATRIDRLERSKD